MKRHRVLSGDGCFRFKPGSHSIRVENSTMASRKVCLPLAVILLLVLAPSAWAKRSANKFDAAVAVAWFDLLYDTVKAENLSPPVAARAYGIASITLYEAIVPGFPGHQSLVGQLNDLPSLPQPQQHKKYHWSIVANSALATSLRHLFPSASAGSLAAIAALEQHFASEFQSDVRPRFFTRSVTQGQVI